MFKFYSLHLQCIRESELGIVNLDISRFIIALGIPPIYLGSYMGILYAFLDNDPFDLFST